MCDKGEFFFALHLLVGFSFSNSLVYGFSLLKEIVVVCDKRSQLGFSLNMRKIVCDAVLAWKFV